jgi:hypothetical protein
VVLVRLRLVDDEIVELFEEAGRLLGDPLHGVVIGDVHVRVDVERLLAVGCEGAGRLHPRGILADVGLPRRAQEGLRREHQRRASAPDAPLGVYLDPDAGLPGAGLGHVEDPTDRQL